MVINNTDDLLVLARGFQNKIRSSKFKLNRSLTDKRKTGNCCVCGKKIDGIREFEHSPYYCYKCHDEAEAVWR